MQRTTKMINIAATIAAKTIIAVKTFPSIDAPSAIESIVI